MGTNAQDATRCESNIQAGHLLGSPASNECNHLPASAQVGDPVRVRGLIGRAELNGRQGQLHEYVVDEDRWKVVMEDGSGLSLRALNLELVPACEVAGSTSSVPSSPADSTMKNSGAELVQ